MNSSIKIKQAEEKDINVIEDILIDAVNHFGIWSKERVSWEGLSREFSIEDFHIAYINDEPAGCMALVDSAPFFWIEKIEKGESLFLRRLAVKRFAAGRNISADLMEYAVNKCREKNIKTLRLDCDLDKEKLNKIYADFGFICEKKETLAIGGKNYPTAFYVYYTQDLFMKKCLIVVDYQNDFVSGSLGFPEAVELERQIVQKIKKYHADGDEVVFTFDTHGEDYMNTQEGGNLPVAHCLKDSDGHKLYGEVAILISDSDKRFYKNTFGSDELYQYLKNEKFESIELIGLVSNICVISNAVLAKTAQPETPVLVDAKCTASNDSKLNEAVLDVMSSLHIQILNRQYTEM